MCAPGSPCVQETQRKRQRSKDDSEQASMSTEAEIETLKKRVKQLEGNLRTCLKVTCTRVGCTCKSNTQLCGCCFAALRLG